SIAVLGALTATSKVRAAAARVEDFTAAASASRCIGPGTVVALLRLIAAPNSRDRRARIDEDRVGAQLEVARLQRVIAVEWRDPHGRAVDDLNRVEVEHAAELAACVVDNQRRRVAGIPLLRQRFAAPGKCNNHKSSGN